MFGDRSYFWHCAHSCCHLRWRAALSHMERLNRLVMQRLQKAARLIRKAGEGGDKRELQHWQMHHRSLQLIKFLCLFLFLLLYIYLRMLNWLSGLLSCCIVFFVTVLPSIFCFSLDVLCLHSHPITQSGASSINPLHSISPSFHITVFSFSFQFEGQAPCRTYTMKRHIGHMM